jgi:BRCA1/BRCA2-containing complex subunit 3
MINDYSYCKLVRITTEAVSSCLNHALLTDNEEVMGLLLGKVDNSDVGIIINIFSTICLSRKCKEKDRVEFDEIQISKASEIADTLEKELKLDVNVVGWYHSHPKITIPPSSVDLNTQFSQQYQGCFVGLIASCFNSDNNNINKINLTAFQTKKDSNGINIPLYIDIEIINENDIFQNFHYNTANSASTFSNILKNLLIEEEEQYNKEILNIDKDDYLNYLLISSNRQSLLTKIIQNISVPYLNALNSEIENSKNYLLYIKELNFSLKKMIKSYEDINKFKEQDE